MDVDWAGLDRSAKSIGGEQNLLLLKTKVRYDVVTLDDAVPVDDGEGLANGGWFLGPPGWMLFIEGSDAQMHSWVDELAAKLSDAGVEGILTGARTVGPPAWGRDLYRLPGLSALFGYQPDLELVPQGWACGPDVLDRVVDHGVEWLCADGAQVQADIRLRADFWASPVSAKRFFAVKFSATTFPSRAAITVNAKRCAASTSGGLDW